MRSSSCLIAVLGVVDADVKVLSSDNLELCVCVVCVCACDADAHVLNVTLVCRCIYVRRSWRGGENVRVR